MPIEQCYSDRIECMVQFQGELNPLGRGEHEHALELDVEVEDEFMGRDIAFWKGGGVRWCGPVGWPRLTWRSVQHCGECERRGGCVDGGCQGGKGAARKPLVEGDVRKEEKG